VVYTERPFISLPCNTSPPFYSRRSKLPLGWKKAREWSRRNEEYVRRAAFSLMAGLAAHDKHTADVKFLRLFPLIERASSDDRNFVKKAVNWALRGIGKRNLALNAAAIKTAGAIRDTGTRSRRWIAADAIRELESEAVQRKLASRPIYS
jgi:3-methyladenine DNA glycosylase AlkD